MSIPAAAPYEPHFRLADVPRVTKTMHLNRRAASPGQLQTLDWACSAGTQ